MTEPEYENMEFEERDRSDKEVVIEVHPLPQKSGKVMDGGDCGYCCIAGIFQLPTILSAYEFMEDAMPKDGGHERRDSMTFYRLKLLMQARGLDYVQFQPPFKHYKTGMLELPWENGNWIDRYQDLIESGTILLAAIRYDRLHPQPPGSHKEHDHNVIFNGYRQEFRPIPHMPKARKQVREVRVSCSAKGTYWMEWSELLYWHGGIAMEIPQKIHGRYVIRDKDR
jgi:hypothetical protein